MFELFYDKDNAILYVFNVVYILYELCGYLHFLFELGFVPDDAVYLYIHIIYT
jgi:hypothetical protein